jgi:glucose-1-phosphate thymidylyltransferase
MIVAVVPAAGRATRLQPLRCSKEALVVRGRPLMEHLLERMRLARCDEIRVVTRPEKHDVVDLAERAAAKLVLGRPPTVPASVALALSGLEPDDSVLIGFPDTLWWPLDAFTTLVRELQHGEIAVGIFRSAEPERGDVVELAPDGWVDRIHTKTPEPPASTIWGCLAARASALAGVGRCAELSDHLRTRRVRGVIFDGDFVDVGTRAALAAVEVPA